MRKMLLSLAAMAALCAWSAAQMTPSPSAPQGGQQQTAKVEITQGPRVESVGADSAVVAWSTNVRSSTVIHYGSNPLKLDQTAQAPWGDMTHRVDLRNLKPNTTYWFRVESGQAEGTGSGTQSREGHFRTSSSNASSSMPQGGTVNAMLPQETATQAQNVQITNGPVVENVGADSAVIAWSTNAGSSAVVHYGTDANNLSQTAQAPWSSGTHRVTLSNLQPNTRYYFQVESQQGQGTGTGSMSAIGQFQTAASGAAAAGQSASNPGTQPVQITNGPVVEFVSDNSAVVAWSTNAQASTVLKYGTDPNNLTQTTQAPWGETTHRVRLSDLRPSTTYYFQVQSAQGQGTGTGALSAVQSFQTVASGAQPKNYPPLR